MFLFRVVPARVSKVSINMSSCGSSDEDCAARRLRQIQQDINQGTFMNWATDEEIAVRKAELERSVREEVRRAASRHPGGRAEN